MLTATLTTSVVIDLAYEAQLISDYLNELWGQWPEVSSLTTGWQRETRKATPRQVLQEANLDLVYDCFPFLFYPDFPEVSIADIRTLTRAARLYSLHAFLSDGLIDAHDMQRADAVLRSSLLQAESLHVLHELFPHGSPFWREFRACQHLYLDALVTEQRLRANSQDVFSLETAERIASGKAALSGAAVAAMNELAGGSDRVQALHESLRLGHIGLQFYDDLRDWKEDFLSGQPSLLLAELFREMDWSAPPASREERVEALSVLKQHLYCSGLAPNAAGRASEYFARARSVLETLPPPASTAREQLTWRRFLRDGYRATSELERDLRRLSPRHVIDGHLTGVKRLSRSPLGASDEGFVTAMWDQAMVYLRTLQGREGEWGDFLFSVGHSTDWITGYVGQALLTDTGSIDAAERAASWLLSTCSDGGWGYNTRAPRDADSTSNCGLFLTLLHERLGQGHRLMVPLTSALNATSARLEGYQQRDGGCSTYIAQDGLAGYYIVGEQWLQPHMEITATCGRYFLTAPNEISARAQAAIRSVLKQQATDGSWHAYWYDGPLYGTRQALWLLRDALQAGWFKESVPRRLQRAVMFLLRTQHENGGWALHPLQHHSTSPVATALALHGLVCGQVALDHVYEGSIGGVVSSPDWPMLSAKIAKSIQTGLSWLYDQQSDDGSWAPTYILRVPAPDCARPWTTTFPHAPRGDLNHVTSDQQRLFTTATVVQMLHAVSARATLVRAPALKL